MSAEVKLYCKVVEGGDEVFTVGADPCFLGRSGPRLEKKVEVERTKGRNATYVVLNHDSISSIHCKIWYEPVMQSFFVQDFKSRNGTYLRCSLPMEDDQVFKCIGDRDQRCEKFPLSLRCGLRLAKTEIMVTRMDGVPQDDDEEEVDTFIDGGTVTEDVTINDLVLHVMRGPGKGMKHVVHHPNSCIIGRSTGDLFSSTETKGDDPASPMADAVFDTNTSVFLIDDKERKMSRNHMRVFFKEKGFKWAVTALSANSSWICPRDLAPVDGSDGTEKIRWRKLEEKQTKEVVFGDWVRCGHSEIRIEKHAGPPEKMAPPERVRGTSTSISLKWSSPRSPTVVKHFILAMRSGENGWDEIFGGNGLDTTIENLTPGIPYYFRIQARNAGGRSEWSNTVCYYTSMSDGTIPIVVTADTTVDTSRGGGTEGTYDTRLGRSSEFSGQGMWDDGASDAETVPFDAPPRKIRWQKGKLLGKGASGEVSAALDLDTNSLMAVKEICLFESDPLELERKSRHVEHEVALLKGLEHPNIVKYLGTERTMVDDTCHICLFMEYVPDGSLSRLLQTMGGVVSEPLAAAYTRQIAEGLAFLHQNRIVHRDIKTDNVLVVLCEGQPICKIADFGSASRLAMGRENFKTFAGTPQFMAPEVVRQKGSSFKCDVWSVACVVIDMLAGEPPFARLSPAQAIYRIGTLTEHPPLPDNVSEECLLFLKAALHIDPRQRLSSRDLVSHVWLTKHRPMGKAPARCGSLRGGSISGTEESWIIPRSAVVDSKVIGMGEHGRVVKACYLDTDVAVKYIALGADETQRREAILREASLLSSLRHPNVLLFMGVVLDTGGDIGLVTEYMEGKDLAEFIASSAMAYLKHVKPAFYMDGEGSAELLGPPTPRMAADVDASSEYLAARLSILVDVAKGVSYLHTRDFIHGDIQPRNILLNKERTHAKVADFGLAQKQGRGRTQGYSLRYCAPECLRGSSIPTAAADVYSLAIVCWELLTAQSPFGGADPTIRLQQSDDPQAELSLPGDPDLLNAICPRGDVAALILAAWSTQPRARPSSREFLTVFRNEMAQ